MRAIYALISLFFLAFAGAAQAADWQVARADEACEARADLVSRGAASPLVVRSDGERLVMQLAARPGAELVRLVVDGRNVPIAATRDGDRIEAPLTPQLERALARGLSVRLVWSRGPSSRASLIGSRRGLAALRDCGEQVRIAKLEAAVQETETAATATEAAAEVAAAEVEAAREAALTEARRRFQQIVLATLGAGVLGVGGYAPEPRAYNFPGVGKIVCSASLEAYDCH